MRCETAQRALSAAFDGEGQDPGAVQHLASCARCQAFERTARRVRAGVRVQAAEQVPDLTARIMQQVAAEDVVPLRRGGPARRSIGMAAVAAALVGVVIGYASFGGLSGGPRGADAGEIAHEVRIASGNLSAYQASYAVTEFGGPQGPRHVGLQIDFASPERYRIAVTQPDAIDPSGNGELRVDGSSWWIQGGRICLQVEECRGGSIGVRGSTLITGRAPFDPGAPMPTDIVLPVSSLSGSEALDVLGPATIDGRDTVMVRLSAADAEPLLSSLQQVGKWRPIWGADSVSVWLDTESWIPLRIEVSSAGGGERNAWASKVGIPGARAGELVLRAEVQDLNFQAPPASAFVPGEAGLTIDEGFREVPVSGIEAQAGFIPFVPSSRAGLRPWRSGVFEDSRAAVLSYARGLRWMRVVESNAADSPDPLSERTQLPGGGVGYYEPSSGGSPRSVSVFAPGWHLTFEGNLTRRELLDAAGSIALRGQASTDRTLAPVAQLPTRLGHAVLLPTTVPPGSRLVSSGIESYAGSREMQLVYARPELEPGGYALRVYEAKSRSIPPAPGDDLISVQVRGRTGRWSPSDHELEWLEDGLYVSLRAPSLELPIVLRIAEDMEGAS